MNPSKILNSSQLPTLPVVALRLLEAVRDPETSIDRIVDLVQSDPAIAAKILKAVNSSYFGLRCEVSSVARAVPILGTNTITTLALSFSLASDAFAGGAMARFYRAYWIESLIQASAADSIARRFHPGLESEYFLAGLLADLGRLAMLKVIPNEYRAVLERVEQEMITLAEAERENLGFDHAEIGAQLLTRWKMAPALCLAATNHHGEAEIPFGEAGPDAINVAKAVRFAASVADYYCSNQKVGSLTCLRALGKEFYALDERELQELLVRVDERISEVGEIMSVDTAELNNPSDLLAQANEQLAQLTIQAQVEAKHASIREQESERQRKVLESQNEVLQHRAMHDPLTGLYNRQFFDESIHRETSRSARQGVTIGVLFCDLDHFKALNDTYGHAFGDDVLRAISQTMQQSVRTSDVVARYGGEEFVILVHQPTEKGLLRLAERIRANIEQLELHHEGQTIRVTASLGAAFLLPKRNEREIAARLVEQADRALYDSKKNGRNRVTTRSLVDRETSELLAAVARSRFSRWLVQNELLDLNAASRVLAHLEPSRNLIGELACQMSLMTPGQVTEILAEQAKCRDRFGEIAIRLGMLTRDQLIFLLAVQQEEPKTFAAALIRENLLPATEVVEALERYLRQVKSELAVAVG